MNTSAERCDTSTIEQAIELMFASGQVVELRILNTEKQGTVSGYFDDHKRLAAAAATWSGQAPAVYVTMNPVLPDCAARAYNRVAFRSRITTSDTDILRRTRLLVDIDPKRPSGISATDEEHEFALRMADTCQEWLTGQGWPMPLKVDSGNGAHLLYCIDLPNDAEATALVSNVLRSLSQLFTNTVVSIDTACANAARIIKLAGTMACKGDALPHRPHRISRIIDDGERGVLVTREQLQAVADRVKPDPEKPQEGPSRAPTARFAYLGGRRDAEGGASPLSGGFNIDEALAAAGWEYRGPSPWQNGRRWVLRQCPWCPDHTDSSAFVVEFAGGALDAGCHHNSCQGNGWPEMRDLLDPGWRDRREQRAALRLENPPHPADDFDSNHNDPQGCFCGEGGENTSTTVAFDSTRDKELLSRLQGITPMPTRMQPEAFTGLPGEIVRAVAPYTEACEPALMVTLLIGMGAILGPGYYVPTDAQRQHANDFACLVGGTGTGRKGTAWHRMRAMVGCLNINNSKYTNKVAHDDIVQGRGLYISKRGSESDKSQACLEHNSSTIAEMNSGDKSDKSVKTKPQREREDQMPPEKLFPKEPNLRFDDLLLSGLGSGEALIEALAQPGADRRRIILEEEFSRLLKVMSREGSTLSDITRAAWDSGTLSHRVRRSHIQAEGGHVSFIGHITDDELKKLLGSANLVNGVGNRYLWCCSHRSKLLPLGHQGFNAAPFVSRLQQVVDYQRNGGEVLFSDTTMRLWSEAGIYAALSTRPATPFGAVTCRAHVHVTRLALIYALLDCDREIKPEHLLAALAVWRFCEESAFYLFGADLGDTALERIRDELIDAYPDAMSTTQIRDALSRHPPAGGLKAAMARLEDQGVVERRVVETGGRPAEYYRYRPNANPVPGVADALQLARDWLKEQQRDAA